ncbi:MAG: ATP synthase F1 subunit gamma [Candidatus Aureabacteria bacterium]|nr:ATP synthase F1 subunit gamma [Candidatus Auribacterota bacterium]
MPTLKDIRNRIKSVLDVEQITKAMKMVAAAKLLKAESSLQFAQEVLTQLEEILAGILCCHPELKVPLMNERPVERCGFMIMTGDRGLCGGFNSNVVRKFLKAAESAGKEKTTIFGIGKKGNVQLKRVHLPMLLEKNNFYTGLSFTKAAELLGLILEFYHQGRVDEVKVIHTRYKPREGETIPVIKLLPFDPSVLRHQGAAARDYLFEPEKEAVLEKLLLYYLQMKVYAMLLESQTSEFFARMTAMDLASNNATELIRTLRLDFNRARQSAITRELIDIVGTAEALKG